MSRTKLLAVAGALLATGTSLVATAGMAGATGTAATGTAHTVTQSSKANYSSAVERPSWSLSCDSASHKWSFAIDGVQIIDSTGHTWGGTQGPSAKAATWCQTGAKVTVYAFSGSEQPLLLDGTLG